MYTPQKPVKELVDDYVNAVFQHMPRVGNDTSCAQDVKDVAYTIIPDAKVFPFTNRVISAGVVYCAFIMSNSRISQLELRDVSGHSALIKYIGVHSISNGSRYVRDFNKLDIVW